MLESTIKSSILKYNSYLKVKHSEAKQQAKYFREDLEIISKEIQELIKDPTLKLSPKMTCRISDFRDANIDFLRKEFVDADRQLKIYENCKEVLPDFKIVLLNFEEQYIEWITRCIVKYTDTNTNTSFEHDFGKIKFNVHIGREKPVGQEAGNNKFLNNDQFHPHISNHGEVCLGGYEGQYREDLENNDLMSLAFNVSILLQKYEPTSVYHGSDISAWLGLKCSVCYNYIDKNTEILCPKTSHALHKECAINIDEKYYSPFIVKKCVKCDKEACDWIPQGNVVVCNSCLNKEENVDESSN